MARASAARLPARRSFVKSSMSAEGFLGRVMASFTTAERVRRGLTPGQRGEPHLAQDPSDTILNTVLPGLVARIHVLGPATKDVDGRDVRAKQSFVASPGHDAWNFKHTELALLLRRHCECSEAIHREVKHEAGSLRRFRSSR